MTGTIVGIEDRNTLLHFVQVRLRVGERSEEPFFFAAPEREADAATRWLTQCSNRAGNVEHRSRTAAVVLRARPVIPRVEMGTDNDPLVWFLTAPNLGNYVVDLHRTGGCVLNLKLKSDGTLVERAAD